MYWHFKKGDENMIADRGIALHKMIRLLTASTINGGYLNFMGNEIPEFIEWRYYEELEWFLLDVDKHKKHNEFVKTINKMYVDEKAWYELDMEIWKGFQWIDASNAKQHIFIYERIGKDEKDRTIVILNFGKDEIENFRVGVNLPGKYKEVLNSNEEKFGGTGSCINDKEIVCENEESHGKEYSMVVKVPKLSAVVLKHKGEVTKSKIKSLIGKA